MAVSLENYPADKLVKTAQVYLFPVGNDIVTYSRRGRLHTREWKIVDRRLPLPFRFSSVEDDFLAFEKQEEENIRLFTQIPAPDSSLLDVDFDRYFDSQLLGRSVANTQWVLIIPGISLLHDAELGIDTFIGNHDEEAVKDIKIVLKTYSQNRG